MRSIFSILMLLILGAILFLLAGDDSGTPASRSMQKNLDVRLFSQADPARPACRTSRRPLFPGMLVGDRIWNATKRAPKGRHPLAALRIGAAGGSQELHWFTLRADGGPRQSSLLHFVEQTPQGSFIALLALGSLTPELEGESLDKGWDELLFRLGARAAPTQSMDAIGNSPPSWVLLTQRTGEGTWRTLGEVLEQDSCAELNRSLPQGRARSQ